MIRPYKAKKYCFNLNEYQIKELDEARQLIGHNRTKAIEEAIEWYIEKIKFEETLWGDVKAKDLPTLENRRSRFNEVRTRTNKLPKI